MHTSGVLLNQTYRIFKHPLLRTTTSNIYRSTLNNRFYCTTNTNTNTNNNNNNNNSDNNIDNNKTTEKPPLIIRDEIDLVIRDSLYDIPEHKECIEALIKKYPNEIKAATKEAQFNLFNLSPYQNMVFPKRPIRYSLVNNLVINPLCWWNNQVIPDWMDSKQLDKQASESVEMFLNVLNQRNKELVKKHTTNWIYGILDPLIDTLVNYDQNNIEFKFIVDKVLSAKRGQLLPFPDRIVVTYHFLIEGKYGFGSSFLNKSQYTSTVILTADIVDSPLTQQSQKDLNWKVSYINPSALSTIPIQQIIPLLDIDTQKAEEFMDKLNKY